MVETAFGGRPALRKTRAPKKYRASELDEMLRTRRTRREAKALRVARENLVPAPELFLENEGKCELVLQKLEGVLLSRKKISCAEARQAGEILAKLHSAGIVHGDFSTSNLMAARQKASEKQRIFVIDFGLAEFSRELEQRADDAIVFEKSLSELRGGERGESPEKLADCFRSGYASRAGIGEARKVFGRMAQILQRARYARSSL